MHIKTNKKVLLRECKRHTARHVASTGYVVPVGVLLSPSWEGWGTTPLGRKGYPLPVGGWEYPDTKTENITFPLLWIQGYTDQNLVSHSPYTHTHAYTCTHACTQIHGGFSFSTLLWQLCVKLC